MCLVSQCTCRNACLTAWADGANQPVVMLAFQPGATVLIRLSASEVARCALQDRMHQQQATSVQIAWKTAWADGANQPVVMLAFQPGATVLIRLSASEVARCALQDRMHQQQATSVQIAWKQIQQYACARTHILVWYN